MPSAIIATHSMAREVAVDVAGDDQHVVLLGLHRLP
jgi:hypothetical protein